MRVNVKRLLNPMICAVAGLFNFIFMFMNYAAVFASQGSESESHGFSAYEALKFGEESLANILKQLLELFGKDAHATFLLVFVTILLILMIILSVGLLLAGCVGLVRELGGINLLGSVNPKLVTRISKTMLKTYFITNIVSAGLLLISCLINLYTGDVYGYKISLGLKPGIGMFFLLIFAVAEWIVLLKLEKKFALAPDAAKLTYQCSTCGAKATDKFCSLCGASVVSIEPTQNEESNTTNPDENLSDESNDNVKNFDYSVITNFFKNIWNRTKEFMKKKNISPKILYIAGGIVLFLIIAVIVLVNIPWPQAATYIVPERDISYVYNETDDQTIILSNGERVKTTIEGQVTLSAQSLDGETMALLSEEGTLYVYGNDSLITASEYVENFKLAAEGSAIAYINDEDELVLYTISDKKSKTITDELVSMDTMCYYLSPDGNSVAYVEGGEEDFVLCVYSGGKRNEVEENAIPFGLSNKAELIYYYNTDNDSIYVLKDDESPIKLVNGISDSYSYSSIQFRYNADHTQVLFCSDSNWYISDNGQEKQKISSKTITQFGNYSTWGLTSSEGQVVTTTPIIDFKEQYFIDSSNTLYYINGKLEALEVAESVESFKTTASSDMVYYLGEYGELYRGEGYGEEFEQIADDVDYFVITSDGKKCYYVDYDDTLRYLKKANKSEKIADDIHSLYMTHDDYALFLTDYSYTNGGTLYSSHNDKEKERISDDIVKLYTTSTSTYYYRNADEAEVYDIYGAVKKIEFNLVAEEISN